MLSQIEAYKFCPLCGGEFEKVDNELLNCKNCKKPFYISPKPCSAAVILNNDNELMLVRRAYDPRKGYWDVPGGFVSLDESIEDSVIREIEEEVGLKLKNLNFLFSYSDRYIYKEINYYCLVSLFLAEVESGEIKAADDVSEVKFFSLDNLPMEDIAFDELKKALGKIRELVKRN